MIEVVDKVQYDREVAEGVVLVDVYAPWCGPCKMIAPSLETLSDKYEDLKVLKVNFDELPDIANELGVMSIPAIITMVDGVVIDKEVGYRPIHALEFQVEHALTLKV